MPPVRLLGLCLCLLLAACSGERPSSLADLNTRAVTLPSGAVIRAEMMTRPEDLARGMKFRDALAEDRGMIFIYAAEGHYRFWMYEVKVPLDIVWMDRNRKIVQVIHNCPPCPGPESACPVYGGDFPAQYILELAAGSAKKHNLKPGAILQF
jgi:uncharacterized membrane protein (UPF0127 family)